MSDIFWLFWVHILVFEALCTLCQLDGKWYDPMHPWLSQLFCSIMVKTQQALVEFTGRGADRTKQMDKPVAPPPAVASFFFLSCFVDLFIFAFYSIKKPIELWVCGGLDIICWWQWTSAVPWDKRPSERAAGAECQEWLRGPSGTSLRHFTSALQLSSALTSSRLVACPVSGMRSVLQTSWKNILASLW